MPYPGHGGREGSEGMLISPREKSRLVIVSNRVPAPQDRSAQAGGLAVVLADGLRPGSLWFGWSGKRSAEPAAPTLQEARGISYATTDLTPAEYQTYYQGFSNSALYPLLLYRLGLLRFRGEDFDGYCQVNARFAASLAPLLRPGDRIWVHDYHLFTLPGELRKRGVAAAIGFFLHTPFPPAGLFAVLPHGDVLLRGVCAADVVGFQTAVDRGHFMDAAVGMLGARRRGEDRCHHDEPAIARGDPGEPRDLPGEPRHGVEHRIGRPVDGAALVGLAAIERDALGGLVDAHQPQPEFGFALVALRIHRDQRAAEIPGQAGPGQREGDRAPDHRPGDDDDLAADRKADLVRQHPEHADEGHQHQARLKQAGAEIGAEFGQAAGVVVDALVGIGSRLAGEGEQIGAPRH